MPVKLDLTLRAERHLTAYSTLIEVFAGEMLVASKTFRGNKWLFTEATAISYFKKNKHDFERGPGYAVAERLGLI